jgi:hypothetical protein
MKLLGVRTKAQLCCTTCRPTERPAGLARYWRWGTETFKVATRDRLGIAGSVSLFCFSRVSFYYRVSFHKVRYDGEMSSIMSSL